MLSCYLARWVVPSAPSSRGDDDEPRRDEGSEEREAVVARELPPDTCSRYRVGVGVGVGVGVEVEARVRVTG